MPGGGLLDDARREPLMMEGATGHIIDIDTLL